MTDAGAVVVGAGPAGLASAAELGRAGIPAVVLERSDAVGSSWRGRYDRLRLNTSRFTSKLPNGPYPRGTGVFPSRDQVVSYLESYAEKNSIEVRLGTRVERVDQANGSWLVQTPAGELPADQVIVATGYEHTPLIPDWPGRDRFSGGVLHAAEYRNSEPFRDQEVLVVGPGCSGVEIAYDLADGAAGKVRLAVRTPPNMLLRTSGGLPGDLPARLLMRLPAGFGDRAARFVRKMSIGDLSEYGLEVPDEGVFTRQFNEGKAPAIVDKEMIEAIKDGRIEIVAAVKSFDESGVTLADGSRIEPDAVIAATGYTTGLESMVGHLGVLDERGVPHALGGEPAAPGLWFIGYVPAPGQIGDMGREATRAAKAIVRRS